MSRGRWINSRTSPDKRAKIIEMLQRGLSLPEIATRQRVTRHVVKSIRWRAGGAKAFPAQDKRQSKRSARIIRLYAVDKLSVAEVARRVGIHHASVTRALIRAGVPRRPRGGLRQPKPLNAERKARKSQAGMNSKTSGAFFDKHDPSKRSLMSAAALADLYAGRRYDDHPSPIAGIFVSINPRAIGGHVRSYSGCAAAMCAERGERVIGGWQ